jgi:hypothetical protein
MRGKQSDLDHAMPDDAMKARVERLLRGSDFRIDDLTRLFLFARDRCDGREFVQEVGDFVAHHDERIKGPTTRSVIDWYKNVELVCGASQAKDLKRLSANYPELLEIAFRRADNVALQVKTGLSKAACKKLLPDILKRFIKNSDGTLAFVPKTHNEFAVAKCLSTVLTVKDVFLAERLFTDFVATLRSNGLANKIERPALEKLKPILSIFAASVMHNCIIRVGTGIKVNLQTNLTHPVPGLEKTSGLLVVTGHAPGVPSQPNIHSPIFRVALTLADYFEPDLLTEARPWSCNLEVTPNKKLGELA